MAKFYVRGIAHTTKGMIVFQERNLKKVKRNFKKQNIGYMILYQKIKRNSKIKYWYKISIISEVLDENKFSRCL